MSPHVFFSTHIPPSTRVSTAHETYVEEQLFFFIPHVDDVPKTAPTAQEQLVWSHQFSKQYATEAVMEKGKPWYNPLPVPAVCLYDSVYKCTSLKQTCTYIHDTAFARVFFPLLAHSIDQTIAPYNLFTNLSIYELRVDELWIMYEHYKALHTCKQMREKGVCVAPECTHMHKKTCMAYIAGVCPYGMYVGSKACPFVHNPYDKERMELKLFSERLHHAFSPSHFEAVYKAHTFMQLLKQRHVIQTLQKKTYRAALAARGKQHLVHTLPFSNYRDMVAKKILPPSLFTC
jgi:hypothetical protein